MTTKKNINQINRLVLQEAYIEGHQNPAAFGRYFFDFDAYEKQEDFLDKSRDAVEVNFNGGNRVGKSFILGLINLHKAFYQYYSPYYVKPFARLTNKYKIYNTSITQAQANISFDYTVNFAKNPKFSKFLGDIKRQSHPTMTIRAPKSGGGYNESEITAISLGNRGTHILGQSLAVLTVDETAFIPYFLDIEASVLRGRLADQGGCYIKISSPNGYNHFYETFRRWYNENDYPASKKRGGKKTRKYLSYKMTSFDNPHVKRPYLADQRANLPEDLFAQNFLAEFKTMSDFFGDKVQLMFSEGSGDQVNILEYPLTVPTGEWVPGRFVMGVDLGFKGDPTVIYVINLDTDKVVWVKELNYAEHTIVTEAIVTAHRSFHPVLTLVDGTGGIDKYIQISLVEGAGLEDLEPFIFTQTSKGELLTLLQGAVHHESVKFPFLKETQKLIHQMSFYKRDDKNMVQDHVMALGLAVYAREEVKRRHNVSTDINPMIAFAMQSYTDGVTYGGDEDEIDFGGGTRYRIDPRSGLLIPEEDTSGFIRFPF